MQTTKLLAICFKQHTKSFELQLILAELSQGKIRPCCLQLKLLTTAPFQLSCSRSSLTHYLHLHIFPKCISPEIASELYWLEPVRFEIYAQYYFYY